MATQQVFVVTRGEYSDYRIEAVFLDRNQAQLYVDIYVAAECYEADTIRVEEHEVDAPPVMFEGIVYEARWWRRDNTLDADESFPLLEKQFRGPRPPKARVTFERDPKEDRNWGQMMSVEGTDKELVTQLRDQRVAEIKATKWPYQSDCQHGVG